MTAWAVEAKVLLGEAIRKYDAPLWPYSLTSTMGVESRKSRASVAMWLERHEDTAGVDQDRA